VGQRRSRTGCINTLGKNRQFPQGLKAAPLLALNGMTKAMPLQGTVFETSSIYLFRKTDPSLREG
jgi:hypothetical protein